MVKSGSLIALLAATTLGGCGSIPAPSGDLATIPLTEFINSMKCEYARFRTNYRGTKVRLKDWTIAGSFQLNVVETQTANGAISGIVPLQGVGALELGFGAGIERKRTTLTTIPFIMQPTGADASVCDKAGELLIEGGIGFGDWLSAIGNSFEAAVSGDPKFGPTGLTREVVFSVEQSRNASGALRLTIVPVSLSASALAKRNDVQTLKVDMKPPEVVVGRNRDGTPKTRPRIDLFGGRLPLDLQLNQKMLVAP